MNADVHPTEASQSQPEVKTPKPLPFKKLDMNHQHNLTCLRLVSGVALCLSWRVHILPFVEQKELYDQFRLDEPWDSPHNKTLIEKMPAIYASNSLLKAAVKPGYTTFQAPVGKQTIFGGPKATKLSQVTDGTSNTIAFVEVTEEKAVPWTSPQDFAFDPKVPLEGVAIGTRGTWISAFADGSVRHLSADIGPKSVLQLFQMNDGNVVDFD